MRRYGRTSPGPPGCAARPGLGTASPPTPAAPSHRPPPKTADLALWTGRLAYADPGWTPGPRPLPHDVRFPKTLAPRARRHPRAFHRGRAPGQRDPDPGSLKPITTRSAPPPRPDGCSCPPASLPDRFDIPHPFAPATPRPGRHPARRLRPRSCPQRSGHPCGRGDRRGRPRSQPHPHRCRGRDPGTDRELAGNAARPAEPVPETRSRLRLPRPRRAHPARPSTSPSPAMQARATAIDQPRRTAHPRRHADHRPPSRAGP